MAAWGGNPFETRSWSNKLAVQDRKETKMQRCTHLGQIKEVTPSANGCEECLRMGDT